MKHYAFIIDVGKCENCHNCFLSCKDEHCGNDWPDYTRPQPLHGHRWMTIFQKERGEFPLIDVAYVPKPCMHCDDAPCVTAGGGAVTKRSDGIVLIDPEKAVGRKDLVNACPYGSIWWNEEEQLPQKCTFCAHLLDSGWQAPRCVQACPTGALTLFAGEESELREKIDAEDLRLFPEYAAANTKPRCYYRNLGRYTHCFLAGSVVMTVDGLEECVVGAKVVLKKEGKAVMEQDSDDFGDFKFDGLEPDASEYVVEIQHHGEIKSLEPVNLEKSLSVGTVNISGAS